MNIVIIEDEVKTAKALGQLILSIRPDAQILSYIQSIDGAVSYLMENDQPDLIFMDIQLADGLCFEIFKNVEVLSPVIFCTAFDDYAIEAFKSNGIDYVLKPFSRDSISQAIKKAGELKNFFQRNKKMMPDFDYLLTRTGENTGKSSFLVFKNNKYQTIQTENIAFFFIKNETPTIMTFDKNEYQLVHLGSYLSTFSIPNYLGLSHMDLECEAHHKLVSINSDNNPARTNDVYRIK